MSDRETGKPTVTISNSTFVNTRKGVSIGPGVKLDASSNHFRNVERPWLIDPTSEARIRGTRIEDDPKRRPGWAGNLERPTTVGWRSMQGPPLPAYCDLCDTVFPSENYIYAGSYFDSWNNKEECPNCLNKHARLSEGIFDLSGDYIRVIAAPEFTIDIIRRLGTIGEDLLNRKIDPVEAVTRFEDVNPKFGELAKQALKIGLGALAFLATVATIDSYRLTRVQTGLAYEQTEIAREGLRLQKEAPPPLTREQMLEILSQLRFTSLQVTTNSQQNIEKQSRKESAAREAPAKASSEKLSAKCKPKARNLKRKQKAARRKAFSCK